MSSPVTSPDPLELELTSDPCILPEVRERVAAWCAARGWSPEQAAEIALAIDEALSNVIRHAYASHADQRIELSLRPVHDGQHGPGLEVRVRDFGRQCHPDEIRGRDLDDVRPGGLGVHIIRAMMNSISYSPAEGGGMLLIMRKYQSHTAARP